jgi:hypothetical protein
MSDEDQGRNAQLEEAFQLLNRLVEDACQHLKQLLAKSKHKLAGFDSDR